jgi:hypothetical protein
VRDDQLHAFLGDARAHAAVDGRRRRHWLARQLDEDRTFAAVCARALEGARPVDVVVTSGRTHRGRLVVADAGVVAVATADGGTVYIAAAALVGVRLRPDATGGPPRVAPAPVETVPGATLGDVLRELAARDVRVEVCTIGGVVHRGRIDGVGRDVLRLAGGMHLRLDLVTEVSPVR